MFSCRTRGFCPSPPGRFHHPQDAVVDRIIDHLKLTFVADRPPPPHIAYQEVLMAAEASPEYFP